VEELAPGLHRWTARHPAWEPGAEPGSPADWPPEVGSVAYQGPDALVLVDPLVADWAPLDALVERHGRPVVVLTTMRFHGRSRGDVAERYGADPRAVFQPKCKNASYEKSSRSRDAPASHCRPPICSWPAAKSKSSLSLLPPTRT
jgi:hypothetical protein